MLFVSILICSVLFVAVQDADAAVPMEHGVVTGVDSSGWTTVTLRNTYTNMVVVASVEATTQPIVTRLQNALSGNSFDVRVYAPEATPSTLTNRTVHYVVVEAGVYTQAADGMTMEAFQFTSTVTDHDASWAGQNIGGSLSNTYTDPVIVGQVMTSNDANWSVFWSMANNATNNPVYSTTGVINIGKTVAEDTNTTRADETLGVIIFESNTGDANQQRSASIGGMNVAAGINDGATVGIAKDLAGPTTDGNVAYEATLTGATTAVASFNEMAGVNGGWAQLYNGGSSPVTASSVELICIEDTIFDTDVTHATAEAGYMALAPDSTLPTVDAFVIPATHTTDLDVPITTFTASDSLNGIVTGYMVTETGTAPAWNDAGWQSSAPATYTVSADGSYTLRAWARDWAGNVSLAATDTVDVSTCTPGTMTAPSGDAVSGNPLDICSNLNLTNGAYTTNVTITEGNSADDDFNDNSLDPKWTKTDIGPDAGTVTESSQTLTVQGGGADIWDAADQFTYLHQGANFSGDFSIQVRVNSQQNTNGWAKAGVMVRQNLTAGSPHVMAVVTPSNGIGLQNRPTQGAASLNPGPTGTGTPPNVWLRLTRTGNSFQGAYSTNGTNWTNLAAATVVMTDPVYIGLPVTSHSGGVLSSVNFDDFVTSGIQTTLYNDTSCSGIDTTGWSNGIKNVDATADDGCGGTLNDTGTINYTACTDGDLATLTTTAPASSSTVGDPVTIQTQVGVEANPENMQNMTVTIGGSSCTDTGGTMTCPLCQHSCRLSLNPT